MFQPRLAHRTDPREATTVAGNFGWRTGLPRTTARRYDGSISPSYCSLISLNLTQYSPLEKSGSAQSLLEPVVRVKLIVEARDLDVAGGAIELLRFGQRFLGLEPDLAVAERTRAIL